MCPLTPVTVPQSAHITGEHDAYARAWFADVPHEGHAPAPATPGHRKLPPEGPGPGGSCAPISSYVRPATALTRGTVARITPFGSGVDGQSHDLELPRGRMSHCCATPSCDRLSHNGSAWAGKSDVQRTLSRPDRISVRRAVQRHPA